MSGLYRTVVMRIILIDANEICPTSDLTRTGSVWNRHEGSNFTECWPQVARLGQLRELCRTITEPSAVAPDAKFYVGNKLGNTLNTQLDYRIRRYRARFCIEFPAAFIAKLNQYRLTRTYYQRTNGASADSSDPRADRRKGFQE